MKEIFNRFKDAVWFNKTDEESIIIGGAGGIGSWLTLFLKRAGFEPIVYDFDKIETHNLGGQLFRNNSVGKYKVTELNYILENFTDSKITTFTDKIDDNFITTNLFMMSAFDNMKARKALFNTWKKSFKTAAVTPLFIDGRLLMEQMQILCVTPDTADKYEEEYLFLDSEVENVSCTMKQTSHSAAMIASLMTGFFTNHLSNIYEKQKNRIVPFYYEFFIPLVTTDIQIL